MAIAGTWRHDDDQHVTLSTAGHVDGQVTARTAAELSDGGAWRHPRAGSRAYFAEAGMRNAFVDLRTRAAGGGWLADAWASPFGCVYVRGDWTRVFDGMACTATMTNSPLATR